MTTLNNGINWSPRLAIYGDMGSTNAQSLSRLINETSDGHFDAILHIGKPRNEMLYSIIYGVGLFVIKVATLIHIKRLLEIVTLRKIYTALNFNLDYACIKKPKSFFL